jgi:hypothetical protein
MPTPAKTPKPVVKPEQALVAFAQNLEEIRRWYRNASAPGHEVGHIVMNELVLSNVSTALDMALQGKRWEAPKHSAA